MGTTNQNIEAQVDKARREVDRDIGAPESQADRASRLAHRQEHRGTLSLNPLTGNLTIQDAVGNRMVMHEGEQTRIYDANGDKQCAFTGDPTKTVAVSSHFVRDMTDVAERMGMTMRDGTTLQKLGVVASVVTTGLPIDVHPGDIPSLCKGSGGRTPK